MSDFPFSILYPVLTCHFFLQQVRTNPEKVRPARTDPSPSLPAESRSPTGVPLFETGAAGEIEEVRFKSINALETSGEEPGGFNGRSWRGTSCAPDGAGTVGEGEDFSGEEQVEAAILLEDAPTAERGDEPGTGDVILAQGKTAEVAPEKQATRVHAEGRETENGHGDKETPERLAEAASIDINGPVEATDVPVAGERASDGAAEETGLQPASAGNAPGHELEATGMDAAGGLAGAKAVPPDSPGAELGAGLSDPAVRTMPPSLLEGTGELPASTGDDATGCSGGCSGKTIATAMSDQVVEGTAEGVEEAADNGAGEEVADDVGEEIGAVPAAGQKEGKGGAGGMLTEDASEAVVQNVDDVPLVVGDAAETVGAASEERDPTVGAVGGIAYSSEKIADGVAGELARAPGEGAAEAPTAVDAVATVEKASNGDPPSETPAAGLQRYWGPDWLEIVFKLVPEEGWAKVCSTHKHGRLLFCLDCACTTRQTQPLCADCFDGDHDGHKSVGVSDCFEFIAAC